MFVLKYLLWILSNLLYIFLFWVRIFSFWNWFCYQYWKIKIKTFYKILCVYLKNEIESFEFSLDRKCKVAVAHKEIYIYIYLYERPMSRPFIQGKQINLLKNSWLEFRSSSGWLRKFKIQNENSSNIMSGESAAIRLFVKITWPTFCQG